ncbi:MAG TPA: hypothetical protein VE974_06760 [Thermoanaerobaculia bacterium]|nr:hypothetical protein [Thermoanaerobaculia bacterium]
MRSYTRVQRAITASMRLIDSTLRAARASERCAHRRPISSSRKLDQASGKLVTASARLVRAAASLQEAHKCLANDPGRVPGAPVFLLEATTRLLYVGKWLSETADHVFTLHEDVLHGLETGELVPEQPAPRRRRIVLVPRPAPVRAFLRARLPRVVDRISAVLQRRRRTRLPASLRVPRRTSQGRAPPLFPVCLL